MRFGFCCPLKLHSKNLSSKPMHRHSVLQKTHSLHLSSWDTAFVLTVLLFSARYVNIFYLLDPQLLACTPIKLEPLISLPNDWASCVVLPMLVVSHSHRWKGIWIQDSFYFNTRICFSYAFRKRRCGFLGLRLSPKSTQIMHSVCGINSQFYSMTLSVESEIFWYPNTAIRRIETGSKTTWFNAYLRNSAPIHHFFKYT